MRTLVKQIPKKYKKKRLAALSAGIATALGSIPAGYAQDAEIEEVVVTGSYIRRSSYEGAQNLQVLGAEQIERSGAVTVKDVLQEFSVNSGSDIGAESQRGTAQFNIRNLGFSSTLTLLNGKRGGLSVYGGSGGTDYLDINMLPLNMIERIEVLADGASALYGSQAVAGVANIITRKGFEGFEVTGGYSDSLVRQRNIGLAVGSRFADDRGGFNFYGSYVNQDGAWRTDPDWLRKRLAPYPAASRFLSTQGSPGSYRIADLDSSGNAVGRGSYIADPDCLAAGGTKRSDGDICRYDFTDQRHIVSLEERYSTFLEFDYQFSDRIRFYNETGYSNVRTWRANGGEQFLTGQSSAGRLTVPGTHPFNFWVVDPADPDGIVYIPPSQWDNAIHTAVDLEANMRPQGTEANHRADRLALLEQNQTRFMSGFEVELSDSWILDLSYAWSRTAGTYNQGSAYRSDIFQDLVKAGEWNIFGTAKASPNLVSPKDGVSVAGNTQFVRDQWLTWGSTARKMTEQIVDVVASGDVFEIDGRTAQLAVGGQYRDLDYDRIDDPLDTATEGNLLRQYNNGIFGAQEIGAVFTELYLPLSDTFDVTLAARYEDYGDDLNTTDPKVSLEWRPMEWLGFRGSWGTSFQAPAIRQVTLQSEGFLADDPASLDINGNLVCVDVGISNGGAYFITGEGLDPQDSENYNLGVVLQLENGLNASLDFWEFDYTDLIAAPESAQAIIENDCLDDGIPNDPRIIRSGNGQLNAVFGNFVNIGSVVAQGMDLNFSYNTGIGPGDLSLSGNWTYVDKFEVDKEDGSAKFDGAGSRNFRNNFNTMPQLRGNVSATYQWGDTSVTGTFRYIDDYTNDQSNHATVDSMETFDIQVSRVFPDFFGLGDTRLILGVNNVTDEDPPALKRNFSDGTPRPPFRASAGGIIYDGVDRPGYDQYAGHSLLGRIVYARFTHDF